jgi:hypothetical protein
MFPRFHALGLLLTTLCGCATPFKTTLRPTPQPLAIRSIVVFPVKLIGRTETPGRIAELSHRVLLSAHTQSDASFSFFAPWEFSVQQWDNDNPWVGCNALPLLTGRGQRPADGLVLRVSAEHRMGSSMNQAFDVKGRRKGESTDAQYSWTATAELVHPVTRTVVVEVTLETVSDPFATPPASAEFDSDFVLTELIEKVTQHALKQVEPFREPPTPIERSDLTLATTPRTLPLDDGIDAVQQELTLSTRSRYLNPTLPEKDAQTLIGRPAGVAVMQPVGKFQRGDVVTQIDGVPAHLSSLLRLRHEPVPAPLTVQSADGNVRTLNFP